MALYRVWADMTCRCYLDVEADDPYEAEEIALDAGGGAFTMDEDTGLWEIADVKEL